jgi:hypothetical protein
VPDRYQCNHCGRGLFRCICRAPRDPDTRSLLCSYTELRRAGIELEEVIGAGGFTEDELKRLDKAATVMKVGFKMVKKVLRKRGVGGRLKPAPTPQAERQSATAAPDEGDR